MLEIDYLIVGAGIAGLCVSEKLLSTKNSITMVDLTMQGSSTIVSSGIINPITGMRFVRSWNFPLLEFHFLKFYESLEKKLNCSFFKSIEIDQCLKEANDVEEWLARTADPLYKEYIDQKIRTVGLQNKMKYNFGRIKKAYLVQTDILIPRWKNWLIENGHYLEREFSFEELTIHAGQLKWQNYTIKKGIVFSEGYRVQSNPYFSWLPVVPLKGECSTLKGVEFHHEGLLKMNYTLCPSGNGQLWCGSSFKINDQSLDFDEEEKQRQKTFISEVISDINQNAITYQLGIRPATRDRKPIVGPHPLHKNLYVLNGFGTKGFSLAPYVSHCFIEFLQGISEIPEEISIDRFKRKDFWPQHP